MEIHELNTFSGTLGSSDYFATDNGNDTSKVSAESMFAPLNARIDNIIAGPAPSAEEIVDARLGADGVTYPSLGDAIRDQVGDLKSDLTHKINPSKNLLNIETNIQDAYVNQSTGELVTYNGWQASDYIPVEANENYIYLTLSINSTSVEWTQPSSVYFAFYNKNKVFTHGGYTTSTIRTMNAVNGDAFLRVSAVNAAIMPNTLPMVGKESDFSSVVGTNDESYYIPYGNTLYKDSLKTDVDKNTASANASQEIFSIIGQVFRTENLFNKYTILRNCWIQDNGNEIYDPDYFASDYMDVSEYQDVTLGITRNGELSNDFKAYRILEYNGSKTVINILSRQNVVAPTSNTKYIRVIFSSTWLNDIDAICVIRNYNLGVVPYYSSNPTIGEVEALSARVDVSKLIIEPRYEPTYAYIKFDTLNLYIKNELVKTFVYDEVIRSASNPDSPLWTHTSYNYTKDALFIGQDGTRNQVLAVRKTDGEYELLYINAIGLRPTDIVLARAVYGSESEKVSLTGLLVEYWLWQSYIRYSLDNTRHVDAIIEDKLLTMQNASVAHGNANSLRFSYVGDPHASKWYEVRPNSTLLAAGNATKNMSLDFSYIAGDLVPVSQGNTLDEGLKTLDYVMRDINNGANRLVVVKGNHDENGNSSAERQEVAWTISGNQFYNYVQASMNYSFDVHWGSKGNNYCYIDFPEQKIRMICLNTSDFGWQTENVGGVNYLKYDTLNICGIRQDQANWLANTAMMLPNDKLDWHVGIFCHVAFDSAIINNSPRVQNESAIDAIVKAYISGTSTTITYSDNVNNGLFDTNVVTNFASQGAKPFIGCFCGHTHDDQLATGAYTSVTIDCALGYNGTGRENYTTDEIAFDIVTIDTTNRKVWLDRVGAGNSRSFNY